MNPGEQYLTKTTGANSRQTHRIRFGEIVGRISITLNEKEEVFAHAIWATGTMGAELVVCLLWGVSVTSILDIYGLFFTR